MLQKAYDIVIVGSGIGGLSTLLYLTETPTFKKGELLVRLIVKDKLGKTNTDWAQGGIAAVHTIGDNFENHIEDTMNAGGFVNNKLIVDKVIKAAPGLMEDLIKWGARFDKNNEGDFDLAKEGGHSNARIWHYEDQTGHSIQTALIEKLKQLTNVTILEDYSLTQAEKLENGRFNLQVYNKVSPSFNTINCDKLVLATGGLGALYAKTTNQSITTGDGLAIANKLGAVIENLSFIQFHPTGLYQNENTSFLISEALRGAGAVLRNEKGEAFMHKYDSRLELAPRDIVSRSIVQEINTQNNKFVYLDASAIDATILNTHFPKIKSTCKDLLNIDIEKDKIPVVPVQHYSCGGVKVNEYGETTIQNLFAIGELANTGLHGANRLASNSLLEAIAFAKFSIAKLIEPSKIASNLTNEIPTPISHYIQKEAIQSVISEYAGIIKNDTGLKNAMYKLLTLKAEAASDTQFNYNNFEAGQLLEVAILLIHDAQMQKKNVGVFFNSDLI